MYSKKNSQHVYAHNVECGCGKLGLCAMEYPM